MNLKPLLLLKIIIFNECPKKILLEWDKLQFRSNKRMSFKWGLPGPHQSENETLTELQPHSVSSMWESGLLCSKSLLSWTLRNHTGVIKILQSKLFLLRFDYIP